MAFQIRRGTSTQRAGVTLAQGELGYDTDTKALYVGDGTTPGGTPVGGGVGSTNAFGTIVVAGQSNVVADAAPDTLTLVAGTGITLTTNAGTDSVTIATSAGGGNMSTSVYDATDTVSEQLVGKTAPQTVENKRLKDTAQIVQAISNPAAIDLNNGNVLTYTMSGNTTFNITTGIQSAGNAQDAVFWLTGNYTPTFQVNGNAVAFANGSPGAQTGGATYLYAIKLNGSANVVGFNAAGSGAIGNLDSLTDVVITTPSNTQVLQYNGTNWVNAAAPSGSGDAHYAIGSGTVLNPTNGTFQTATLSADRTFTFTGFSSSALKLTVALTASGADRTPTFNGVDIWGDEQTPGAIPSGNVAHYNFWSPDSGTTIYGHKVSDGTVSAGSASNSFATISVSGQSDVVADSSTDTLTLVAGSNITLTTNAGADSITIAASGSTGVTTIAEEGSALTQRATLNFIGAGVTAADNAGQTRTDVTIADIKPWAEQTSPGATITVATGYSEITLSQAGHTVNLPYPAANSTSIQTTIKVVQDGTGSRTVTTWQANGVAVVWVGGSAPTLKTAAAAWDLVTFTTRKNGSGTVATIGTWIGASS